MFNLTRVMKKNDLDRRHAGWRPPHCGRLSTGLMSAPQTSSRIRMLKGRVNIPLKQLDARIGEVAKDKNDTPCTCTAIRGTSPAKQKKCCKAWAIRMPSTKAG